MNLKKFFFFLCGILGLVLGAIGAVLPLLPAFPFLLLALICFGKSSERMHRWFVESRLYKRNLESFVRGEGMTRHMKLRILLVITFLFAIGFVMMAIRHIYVGCTILVVVWLFHVFYFIFKVGTIQPNS